jgi:hypothetical protein
MILALKPPPGITFVREADQFFQDPHVIESSLPSRASAGASDVGGRSLIIPWSDGLENFWVDTTIANAAEFLRSQHGEHSTVFIRSDGLLAHPATRTVVAE